MAEHGHPGRSRRDQAAFERGGGPILVALLRGLGEALSRESAYRLIAEHGTLADALRAKPASHHRLLGDLNAWRLLQPVRRAIRYYHAADLRRGPLLDNWTTLLEFLRVELAASPVEHFRVLHLDGRNHLIRDETMARGTVEQAAVYVREVMCRALDLGSASIILVHNHPSGDCKPSSQDIRLTRQIAEVAKVLGIAVHDHLIVARDGHSSMKVMGLI